MKRSIWKCLLGLWLGVGAVSAADQSDDAKKPLSDEVVALLLKKAADWKVPQPKAESKLIKMWAYRSDKEYYSLGFVEPDAPSLALIGFQRNDIGRGTEIIPIDDPASCSLDNVAPTSPFGSVHELNTGLVTGIQLLRIGHREVRVRLLQKSLREESGHHLSSFK